MNDDTDVPDFMTLKTKVRAEIEDTNLSPGGDKIPLLGLFAVGFSLLGIFVLAPVFAPLGLILGGVALFMRQVALGLTAIILAGIAVITSPSLLAIVGLSMVFARLGIM